MLCYQYVAPLGLFRPVWAERIVAQRASILVASPRPTKTRWPCRGRRLRVNKTLHRWFATDMSPLWGFEDAGAGMSGYRYVAPLGLCRHVCAERIVAQRASILVASPRPTKMRWPCRGRRPRVTGLMRHVCAERIVAQRANILVASPRPTKMRWPCRGRRPRVNKPLRRCFATNMSPLWGFEDAGAAMFCYQYVAPLGLLRRWRGDVLRPICRPAGACAARTDETTIKRG
jgi:hypothetical protein